MGGLLQSVGNGVGGVVGGAIGSIASSIHGIVDQAGRVVPGGFPVVPIVTVVVIALIFVSLIRH
jgi:hypothetical protein